MANAGARQISDPLEGSTKYSFRQALNAGTFGFVNLYKNNVSGEDVAIKFLERGEKVNRYVEFEVMNHRILRHPHVIEFKEVFLTPKYICIAMEYASGGNLFNYVQKAARLKEPAARWFFQQLVIGLDYCHKKGVVNRDIKLENTLLQMVPSLPLPLLKICDFGYSKAQFMSAPKSKVGTLAYMAPEVVRANENYDGKLSDIWSCGIMLYVMLFGMYPFDGPKLAGEERAKSMMSRIMHMQWQMPPDVPISADCRDLLERLIVADPAKRLRMEEIQAHPWFRANLPGDALSMNDHCLANNDYSGVQSVESIQAILRSAQAPPARNNFFDEDASYEDIIDETIQEEVGMSADWTAAAQGQGQPGAGNGNGIRGHT